MHTRAREGNSKLLTSINNLMTRLCRCQTIGPSNMLLPELPAQLVGRREYAHAIGRRSYRQQRNPEHFYEHQRVEQFPRSAAGGCWNTRGSSPGAVFQRGHGAHQGIPLTVGREETPVSSRGFQRVQPSELHESEPEPGVAADVRRVSGHHGTALHAVRAAFGILSGWGWYRSITI
jgi:hypothetical protein